MAENSSLSLVKNKLYSKPTRASKLSPIEHEVDSNDPLGESLQKDQTNENRMKDKKMTAFGFQNANFQLALERKKQQSNRYYKGQQVPYTVDNEHFKVYGAGIYLFFQFLKQMSILFFVLSLISLVPILYNYIEGNRFANSVSSLSIYVGQTSISSIFGNDPSLSQTQQRSVSSLAKLVNCIADLTISLLITIFYFYWTGKSAKITEDIKKSIKLTNYYTIQLNEFPQSASEHDVYKFFNKFGMVTEVAPVKNFSDTIQLSKEIYELQVEMKILKLEQREDSSVCNKQKIAKIQLNMNKLYKELAKEQGKSKEDILKYYVSFATPLQRGNTLKRFNKVYNVLCYCCAKIPEDYLLKGQKVQIKACHDQPGEILWQNVHITWKSRWLRALAQLFLLLIFITIGFFVIALLNILTPPSEITNIATSSYNITTILTTTNVTLVESWCLKNTDLSKTTTALNNLCSSYITKYYYKLAITYCITVVVIIVKALLKQLVIFIAKFQRYKQYTQQSIDIVKNLVILYIITTVIISFLLQIQLFGLEIKNFVPQLIKDATLKQNANLLRSYLTLSHNWYIDIGYQIWITWLVLAFTPHLYMPFVNYALEWFRERRAKSQKLQAKMDKAVEANQFEIEDQYANIIMVFLVGITFSGGMPTMIILTFIGLATRYIAVKFMFIRFCKVPRTIDQALNETVMSYIPWALLIHFFFTIWMYSVETIFVEEHSIFSEMMSSASNYAFLYWCASIIRAGLTSYYYTLTAAVIMFSVLVKEVLYDFITTVMKKEDDFPEQLQKQDTAEDLVGQLKSQRGITSSYKIQNNPNYSEILSIKQKMRDRLAKGIHDLDDEKPQVQNTINQ